jgi:hypothetical protein
MLGDEQRIIDKHVLAEVFKIYHTRETNVNQVEMTDVRVALTEIINTVCDIYNTNER